MLVVRGKVEWNGDENEKKRLLIGDASILHILSGFEGKKVELTIKVIE